MNVIIIMKKKSWDLVAVLTFDEKRPHAIFKTSKFNAPPRSQEINKFTRKNY